MTRLVNKGFPLTFDYEGEPWTSCQLEVDAPDLGLGVGPIDIEVGYYGPPQGVYWRNGVPMPTRPTLREKRHRRLARAAERRAVARGRREAGRLGLSPHHTVVFSDGTHGDWIDVVVVSALGCWETCCRRPLGSWKAR